MNKVQRTFALLLLTLNTISGIVIIWRQIAVAAEGRRLALHEQAPTLQLLVIAVLVLASGALALSQKGGAALLAGASLAVFLTPFSLMLLGGAGL